MALCPSCDYPIPDDRERVGARCPNCRDPLYEPPGRFGRPVREGEGACSVHPECESVGPCGRCGNFMCETCRTRWREQILCAACVDRALESREAAPEQSRTHFRQALTALVLGVGAWVLGVVGAGSWIPANTADNWLHFALGLGMIALGFVTTRGAVRAAATI